MRTEDNQITGRKKEEEERCDKIIGSNNRWRERGWSWAVQRFFLSAEP